MPCIHVHMLRALLRRRVGVALGLQEIVERQHRSSMQHAQQTKRRPAVAASGESASTLQARLHVVMLSWAWFAAAMTMPEG